MAEQAQEGNKVKVHYTGKLTDGTIFDSSQGREPLEFTVGEGRVIPGFEQAVKGMAQGEKRETTVPPEQAYGAPRDELIVKVPRDTLPPDLEPKVGEMLYVKQPDGGAAPVRVADIADDNITLDANHPLAGKELTFEIELVEVA